MGQYRCKQCGCFKSETPFCHGPMEDVQAAEIERLRASQRSSDDQFSWLGAWCRETLGVDSNRVICEPDWPNRIVEVVAMAAEKEIERLRADNEQLGQHNREMLAALEQCTAERNQAADNCTAYRAEIDSQNGTYETEMAKLRADLAVEKHEAERLRAERDNAEQAMYPVENDRIEELEAEIERLRAALLEACEWAVAGNFPEETEAEDLMKRLLREAVGVRDERRSTY